MDIKTVGKWMFGTKLNMINIESWIRSMRVNIDWIELKSNGKYFIKNSK
jgi:hypothetical protein